MQIQRVNNNEPNFQALRVSTIKKGAQKIDIFSLDKNDFMFLNAMKGKEVEGVDKRIIGGETVGDVFQNAVNRAQFIGKNSDNKVLVAVEGNKLTGVADYAATNNSSLMGLAVFNKSKVTREGLLHALMNEANKAETLSINIPLKLNEISSSLKSYLQKFDFIIDRKKGKISLPPERLSGAMELAQKSMNADVKTYKAPSFVDLNTKGIEV